MGIVKNGIDRVSDDFGGYGVCAVDAVGPTNAHIKPAAKVNAAIANQVYRRLVSMCCYRAIGDFLCLMQFQMVGF